MYDFSKHLFPDEKILYQGKPTLGKTAKDIKGILLFIGFALLIQIVMILSVITGTGDGKNGITLGFILIFLVVTLFLGLGIYGLFYNVILKKKRIADNAYCLTNIRAMKYESKKGKFVFGYLAHYDDYYCSNVKNNFGDVYMGIIFKEQNGDSATKTLLKLKDLMMKPDPENMPFINFESIEDPYNVIHLIEDAKQNIKKEENQFK